MSESRVRYIVLSCTNSFVIIVQPEDVVWYASPSTNRLTGIYNMSAPWKQLQQQYHCLWYRYTQAFFKILNLILACSIHQRLNMFKITRYPLSLEINVCSTNLEHEVWLEPDRTVYPLLLSSVRQNKRCIVIPEMVLTFYFDNEDQWFYFATLSSVKVQTICIYKTSVLVISNTSLCKLRFVQGISLQVLFRYWGWEPRGHEWRCGSQMEVKGNVISYVCLGRG